MQLPSSDMHKQLYSAGMEALVSHLVGGCLKSHVAWLLDRLALPEGACLVDMGCGTGAPAAEMARQRPDLVQVLVNNNAEQAADADLPVLVESFHRTTVDTGTCDLVLFQYAFVHAQPDAAFQEARRLLREGGRVALYEPFGDNRRWREMLPGSTLWSREEVIEAAEGMGFTLEQEEYPDADSSACRRALANLGEASVFEATFAQIRPGLLVFRRNDTLPFEAALARHAGHVALQFSGGRDSLAVLFALREFWSQLTVYHGVAGDPFPETTALVNRIASLVPRFVMFSGRLAEVEKTMGLASDLVPTQTASWLGRQHAGCDVKLIDRYECCYQSLMKPMHERILADGISLVIRGQRDSDYVVPPMRSGETDSGIEVLYPIQGWSDQRVLDYLAAIGVAPTPFYREGLQTTPECMTCSAWWDDGRAAYLAKHHPAAHSTYLKKLIVIHREVQKQMRDLHNELGLL